MNQIKIDPGKLKNSCFVGMPFSSLYQTEYEKVIRPTLEEMNVECIRGDEVYSQQRIMDDIWSSIRSCRFVIAELTGRNPNVLYEVGLAHAIGKPVIIMTRNADDVPFDLKDLRYLFYDINDPFWGENLRKGLKSLIQEVIENPSIETYLTGISKIDKYEFPKIQTAQAKTDQKTRIESLDVSGEWPGSWNINGKHNVVLQIAQVEEDISAVANISFYINRKISVVQQIITGKIDGKKVRLLGVNYTYIERGDSENYLMDTLDLDYNEKKDILLGKVVDSGNGSAKVNLRRVTLK